MMTLGNAALQVPGLSDILYGIFTNQLELEIVLLSIAGYTFLSMTARRTWLWDEASTSEKYLIGIAIGLGFEGLLIFTYVGYLFFERQFVDLESAFNYTALWTIIFLTVISIVLRSGEITESTYRRIVSVFAKLVLYITEWLLVFIVTLLILVDIAYSSAVSPLLVPFLAAALIFWDFGLLYSAAFWYTYHNVFHKHLPTYKEFRERKKRPNLEKFARRFASFDRKSAIWRGAAITGLAAVIVVGGVSLDLQFAIFTPSLSYHTAPYTGGYPSSHVGYYLEITGEGVPMVNGTKACHVDEYQTYEQNVTIRVPLLSTYSVRNLSLQNPRTPSSGVSIITGSSTYDVGQTGDVWNYVTVMNPDLLQIIPKPNSGAASSFNVGFANKSAGSKVAIGTVYYLLVALPQIECTASIHYSKVNGTATVTEAFDVRNDGNLTALVKVVHLRDISWLIQQPLLNSNKTSMTFYWHNNLIPFLHQAFDEIAPVVGAIPPGNQTTFTLVATGPGTY